MCSLFLQRERLFTGPFLRARQQIAKPIPQRNDESTAAGPETEFFVFFRKQQYSSEDREASSIAVEPQLQAVTGRRRRHCGGEVGRENSRPTRTAEKCSRDSTTSESVSSSRRETDTTSILCGPAFRRRTSKPGAAGVVADGRGKSGSPASVGPPAERYRPRRRVQP